MKELKLVFGLSNFLKQNEPKIAATIGNIALILGMIVSIPTILATGGLAVPATIIALSIKATTGLLLLKSITKMFGFKDVNGNAVNVTCPPTPIVPTNSK